VTTGRRMRVDTTVVETDVHHPTDSTLLGDGVRVLTRMMKKITKIAGAVGTKLRDRSRSVKFRLLEIGRVARAKGSIDQDKLKRRYGQLLDATSRVVGQAKRFSAEIFQGVKRARSVLEQLALEGLRQELDLMASRVRQVMKQTRADARVEGCQDSHVGIERRKHAVSGANRAKPPAHQHQFSGNIDARARIRHPRRRGNPVDQGAHHQECTGAHAPRRS
jgi:hypothetical protein